MNIAVILAGGSGLRLGADIPKQFIKIMGKPILIYTIEAFQNHNEIDAIEVVCIESYIDTMKDLVREYNLSKVKWVTVGGADFQASVLNGVNNLEAVCKKEDTLLIHFGASPFVSDEIISDSIKVCKEKGNAISTSPFFLLSGIRDGQEEASSTWIDRNTIACMNSPHAFQYSYISDLYDRAISSGIINEVEPHTTTLMHKMNEKIYFSKGSQSNIKITTKEDLDLFEGFVLLKKSREL